MADPLNQIERKEQAPVAPSSAPKSAVEAPQGLSSARQDIAGALGEAGGEFVESGEKIRETAAEGREVKGDAAAKGQQTKKDDGQAATGGTATATFLYDDQNLPAVPDMIRKIEQELRSEIRNLERDAQRYRGGFLGLRKPDFPRYSETMIELRDKNVLLKRIAGMAAEALKKLFLQMFGPKKTTK